MVWCAEHALSQANRRARYDDSFCPQRFLALSCAIEMHAGYHMALVQATVMLHAMVLAALP